MIASNGTRAFAIATAATVCLASACSSNDTSTSSSTHAVSVSASAGSGTGGGSVAAPYTIQALDNVRIGSDSNMPNFQKATADIDLKDGPFTSVTLHVTLATTCYPFDNWKTTDQPPAGQNYPADCDAFDRNFETSLFPPGADASTVGVELVRAITPFGGPEDITEDITDVANGLPGKGTIQVVIPTYSDGAGMISGSNGGWNVTVSIDVVPGPPPRNVLAVVPLYYDSDTVPEGPGPLAITAPEGVASSHVDYRATGHGGASTTGDTDCIGPAEEFCKREHHITVDGTELPIIKPWRADCSKNCTIMTYSGFSQPFQYCVQNPTGNVSSVKAPRANWCPSTETPPMLFDIPATPGAHTFQWAIPKLAAGGQWRISATYFAYGP